LRFVYIVFLIILLSIAFVFGSQNAQIITLNYLVAQVELTIATALSIFFGIGFCFGLITAFFIRRSTKKRQLLSTPNQN
jgi:putative membrane protein